MKKQKGEGIGEIRKDSEHNNNQLGAKDGAGRGARKAALVLTGCVACNGICEHGWWGTEEKAHWRLVITCALGCFSSFRALPLPPSVGFPSITRP